MQSKKYLPTLVVLYTAAFVSAYNENIINVALMDIMAQFQVSSATAQWLVTGYMIVTSVIVTVMAFLSQRFTLRQLFFSACGFLIVGSALCLVMPTYPLLLASRLLQAVGTGIFIPIMMNTVLATAPKPKLGTYLSIGGAAITLGPAFAPVISGIMVTFFGWRSIFVLPAVIVLALVLVGTKLIRNVGETRPATLDVFSLVLSAVGLTLFVYGLGEITSAPLIALAALAVGIAAIALFVRRQFSIRNPMLDLHPMRNPRFSVACVLVIVAMMTTFSMSVLLPLYFEGAFSSTALVAGALILPPIAVNAVTSIVGGRTMDRFGEWPLLPLGFALIAAGQLAVAIFGGASAAAWVVACSVIVYAGVGLVMSPSQTAGLKRLAPEENPHGVAIVSTIVMVAASIGPSLFIGVLSTASAAATAAGATGTAAVAAGFSQAVLVAAAIAAAGFAIAAVYAWRARRSAAPAPVEKLPAPSLPAVMKHDAYAVTSEATVREVATLLVRHRTSGVPVVDADRHVVGFVSDGDIMRGLARQETVAYDLAYYLAAYDADEGFSQRVDDLLGLNVMELASSRVVSVEAGTPLAEVCSVLREKRIKKVPVLADGVLAGTVSRSDIVRYLMSAFVVGAEGKQGAPGSSAETAPAPAAEPA